MDGDEWSMFRFFFSFFSVSSTLRTSTNTALCCARCCVAGECPDRACTPRREGTVTHVQHHPRPVVSPLRHTATTSTYNSLRYLIIPPGTHQAAGRLQARTAKKGKKALHLSWCLQACALIDSVSGGARPASLLEIRDDPRGAQARTRQIHRVRSELERRQAARHIDIGVGVPA